MPAMDWCHGHHPWMICEGPIYETKHVCESEDVGSHRAASNLSNIPSIAPRRPTRDQHLCTSTWLPSKEGEIERTLCASQADVGMSSSVAPMTVMSSPSRYELAPPLGAATPLSFLVAVAEETRSSPDALVVLAKGLAEREIILDCLADWGRAPDAPTRDRLVFVLHVNDGFQRYLASECLARGFAHPPVRLDESHARRKEHFASRPGGIYLQTCRTLVLDLLAKDAVRPGGIHGIVVCRAHEVQEHSLEAFVVRLARLNSPKCFVRGFTNRPEAMGSTMSVYGKMRALGARELVLWPRFRHEVKLALDAVSPACEERRVAPSELMMECQRALLAATETCLRELGLAANAKAGGAESGLDPRDLTVEAALFRPHAHILSAQLGTTWRHVSAKARGLIADLAQLRRLLLDLVSCDSVAFYERMLRARREAEERRALWLLTDAADDLFRAARRRIYHARTGPGHLQSIAGRRADGIEIALEESPKMVVLERVLQDIAREQRSMREKNGPGVEFEMIGGKDVVVVVPDEFARQQVGVRLSESGITEAMSPSSLGQGASPYLMARLAGLVQRALDDPTSYGWGLDRTELAQVSIELERRAPRRASETANTRHRHFRDSIGEAGVTDPFATFVGPDTAPQSSANKNIRSVSREDQLAIVTLAQVSSGFFERIRPRFIVAFSPDLELVREVETFQAARPNWPLRFIVLYFERSVEEQRYLASIKRERDAFLRLVDERMRVVVPTVAPHETLDGSDGTEGSVVRDVARRDTLTGLVVMTKERAPSPSTSAAAAAGIASRVVVVDAREINAGNALPMMLHLDGYTIYVRQLAVGDYVLSPEVCIERKSPSDLVQSLANGRLLKQCEFMVSRYRRPCLLIEYGDSDAFEALDDVERSAAKVGGGVAHKLVTLSLSFPQIKILWSRSPRATVGLFRELQRNQPPPSPDVAAAVESARGAWSEADGVNVAAMELLRRLPGVTPENLWPLARTAKSLARLAELDVETLVEPMGGRGAARELREFLDSKLSSSATTAPSSTTLPRAYADDQRVVFRVRRPPPSTASS